MLAWPIFLRFAKTYTCCIQFRVIRSFQHKGLEAFFRSGSKAGIRPDHAQRLQLQLGSLDQATQPQDMAVPGW